MKPIQLLPRKALPPWLMSLALVSLLVNQAQPSLAEPANNLARRPKQCVVLDNDYDIDDMQALPLVIANTDFSVIVQTEGATLPRQAAAAAATLVRGSARPGSGAIPIVVGGGPFKQQDPMRWSWLPFFRSMMHRSNGLLKALPDPWPIDPLFPQSVAEAVARCSRVSILLTGPYTSFNHYLPLIRHKVQRVVIQGAPLPENLDAGEIPFNCAYDLEACGLAKPQLKGLPIAFVDLPELTDCRGEGAIAPHCYTPSLAMVVGHPAITGARSQGLADTGLAGRLKQALVNDISCSRFYTTAATKGRNCSSLSTWVPSAVAQGPGGEVLLWDQVAALFFVNPQAFTLQSSRTGRFQNEPTYRPTLVDGSHAKTVERLRTMWTAFTNQSKSYAPITSSP